VLFRSFRISFEPRDAFSLTFCHALGSRRIARLSGRFAASQLRALEALAPMGATLMRSASSAFSGLAS
jgi:hypothetical protein